MTGISSHGFVQYSVTVRHGLTNRNKYHKFVLTCSKIFLAKAFSFLSEDRPVLMKRELAEEMSAETPSLKKIKFISDGEGLPQDDKGEQWTKVEKKKKKKINKAESKADVCIHFLSCIFGYTSSFLFRTSVFLLMTTYYLFNPQNAHPRFMYSNTEIIKRHHAITIDVSWSSVSLGTTLLICFWPD